MKRIGLLFAVIILTFVSCNFNFTNSDSDDTPSSLRCVTQTDLSVQLCSWYDEETLKYYEEQYILGDTKDTSRLIDQVQRYSDSGTLRYTYRYTYTPDNLPETVAYYDSSDSLQWFYVYSYVTVGSETKIAAQYEFNAAGVLQWARKYTWVDAGSAAGQVEMAIRFESDSSIERASRYYFLPNSDRWNVEVSCGPEPGSLEEVSTPSAWQAGEPDTENFPVHGRRALTEVTIPVEPVLLVPADIAATELPVSGYRFAYEDEYGLSRLTLDPEWYPLFVYRTDSRIGDEALFVSLSYDGSHRIIAKSTSYGSTEALVVEVEYDDDSFPAKISTRGAAMLLPLEYAIDYGTDHQLNRITVTSADSPLMYFDYAYTVPAIPSSARSIDPFDFIDSALSSTATITHYDGDGNLQETFTGHVANPGPGISFDVTDSDGEATGAYTITTSTDGIPVSLAASTADGSVVWSCEFASGADFFDKIKNESPSLADLAGGGYDYGRLLETWIPGDSTDVTAAIAKNFLYDLLF